MIDIGVHPLDLRNRFEKLYNGRIFACQRSERRLVMRIRQAPRVENEIGVERRPMLEAERFEQQRELRAIDRDEILDPRVQRRGRQIARIECDAELARFQQQAALVFDRFGQRTVVARERVAPPRFGEALDQRIGFRIQIEERHLPAGRARSVDGGPQAGKAGSRASVERYGDPRLSRSRQIIDYRPGLHLGHRLFFCTNRHLLRPVNTAVAARSRVLRRILLAGWSG